MTRDESDCPWCRRPHVPIVANAVLATHAPGRHVGERDCPMSGKTLERAQQLTNEANRIGGMIEMTTDLRRVADAAWRTQEWLNLNLFALAKADIDAAGLAAILNELSDVLPLREDGPDWR